MQYVSGLFMTRFSLIPVKINWKDYNEKQNNVCFISVYDYSFTFAVLTLTYHTLENHFFPNKTF